MSSNEIYKTLTPPRVDFNGGDYETLIFQKGREVLFEKALQCPCKSPSVNQQSNCRSCGGMGWLYVNPKSTRMLIQGVSFVTDYKPWSEESRGMINVTCSQTEQLTFMDRLTLLDGIAIHNEVVEVKKKGNQYFFYSTYPIKSIIYGGFFLSSEDSFIQLDPTGLEYNKNLVKVPDTEITLGLQALDFITLTLRYYHAPVYYILEMKRETMQSYKYDSRGETIQNLPLSAVARRSHFMSGLLMTLDGVSLLGNNYIEAKDCSLILAEAPSYHSCQTFTVLPSSLTPKAYEFPFTNVNSVTITHNLGRYVDVEILDPTRQGATLGGGVSQEPPFNQVIVTFSEPLTGVVIVS